MNQVAVVTGGNGGIGSAITLEFAKRGYHVVVNYFKNEKKAFELKEKLEKKFPVKILLMKADVSNEKEVIKMSKDIISNFGRIDVLVNNAGIAIDKDFDERTIEDWNKTLSTNLIGPFLVSKYIGKEMMKIGGEESLIFQVQTE